MRVGFDHSGSAKSFALSALALAGVLLAVAFIGYGLAPAGGGATTRLVINFFITVVIVVGLQVFTGNSGIPSYGHASFVGIGAYVTALLTIDPAVKDTLSLDLPGWLLQAEWGLLPALLVASLVGGLVALLVGGVIMKMKETATAMSTLALLVILHGVYNNWTSVTRGTGGLDGLPVRVDLPIACAAAILTVGIALAFKYSRAGLKLRATRDDSLSAATSGVSVYRARLAAWVLSAIISAAAGSIWAQFNYGFAPSQFYFTPMFSALSMLVIGGMATVSGAVIGAGLVTVVSELLRGVEDRGDLFGIEVPTVTGLTQIVLATVTLVVLIYRRDGILGWRELSQWVGGARHLWYRIRGETQQAGREIEEVRDA